IAGNVSVDRRNVTLPAKFEEWLIDKCLPDSGQALLGWSDATSSSLSNLAWEQPLLLSDLDLKLRSKTVVNNSNIVFHSTIFIPANCGLSITDERIIQFAFRKRATQADPLLMLRLFELRDVQPAIPQSMRAYLTFSEHEFSIREAPLKIQLM